MTGLCQENDECLCLAIKGGVGIESERGRVEIEMKLRGYMSR